MGCRRDVLGVEREFRAGLLKIDGVLQRCSGSGVAGHPLVSYTVGGVWRCALSLGMTELFDNESSWLYSCE